MEEPKYGKGDYIINRKSKDIAIVKEVDKKGYYHFSAYLSGMFGTLKEADKTFLFFTYQQFFEPCNDDERKIIDNAIASQHE